MATTRPAPDAPVKREERGRMTAGAVAVMSLFAFWSGALGAGFITVAVVGADEMSPSRQIAYAGLAVLLLALSGRTAYEMVRRLRRQR